MEVVVNGQTICHVEFVDKGSSFETYFTKIDEMLSFINYVGVVVDEDKTKNTLAQFAQTLLNTQKRGYALVDNKLQPTFDFLIEDLSNKKWKLLVDVASYDGTTTLKEAGEIKTGKEWQRFFASHLLSLESFSDLHGFTNAFEVIKKEKVFWAREDIYIKLVKDANLTSCPVGLIRSAFWWCKTLGLDYINHHEQIFNEVPKSEFEAYHKSELNNGR